MQSETTNLVSWPCFRWKTTFCTLVLTQANGCGEAGRSALEEGSHVGYLWYLRCNFPQSLKA